MKRVDRTIQPEHLGALCERLAELHVHRNHYVRAVIRETNSVAGLLRRALGYQWDMPETEGDAINKRALRIVGAFIKGDEQRKEDEALAKALSVPLTVAKLMCLPPSEQRQAIEKDMRKFARMLPVWPWAEQIRGLSDLGLAIIVAEAGDINNYSTFGKLRKRFGLAPVTKNGVTRACSTWRRMDKSGLSADDWKDQGPNGPKYKPPRRAAIFSQVGAPVIGCMGKGPRPFVGEDISGRSDLSEYQKIFINRLRHEAARDPEHMGRPPTKEGKESFSKYAAARAQRYVEQRLCKHLQQAWRRAGAALTSIEHMSAATSSASAERPAMIRLNPNLSVPGAVIAEPVSAGVGHIGTDNQTDVAAPTHAARAAKRRATSIVNPKKVLPDAPYSHAADEAVLGATRTMKTKFQLLPDLSADEAERQAKYLVESTSRLPDATSSDARKRARRSASVAMESVHELQSAVHSPTAEKSARGRAMNALKATRILPGPKSNAAKAARRAAKLGVESRSVLLPATLIPAE